MLMRTLVTGGITFALLVLVPGTVLAQDNQDPIALFNQASDLADAGKLEQAVSIWLLVQDTIPAKYRPVVQVNLGLAFKKMGRFPEAWHHLRMFLKSGDDADALAWVQQVEESMAETHVKYTVSCEPDDARVYLQSGGAEKGYDCPATWWFKPGKQAVRVEREGYKNAITLLDVPADKKVAETVVKLVSAAVWGYLVIEGDARSVQVFIDGMLEGKVPFKRKLKPGNYEIMVGPPGKLPWKKKITVVTGKTITEKPVIAQKTVAKVEPKPDGDTPPGVEQIDITKQPDNAAKRERSNVGPWLTVGGGAALLVVGGILQGAAYSANEQLRSDYPDGSDGNPVPASNMTAYEQGYEDDVRPKQIASYVLYGVGGAATAAGVVWLIVNAGSSNEKPDKGLKVSPMAGPDLTGAMVEFTF